MLFPTSQAHVAYNAHHAAVPSTAYLATSTEYLATSSANLATSTIDLTKSTACLAIGPKALAASKDAKIPMLLREGRFSHAPKSTLRRIGVTAVQTPSALATAPQGCTLSGFLP